MKSVQRKSSRRRRWVFRISALLVGLAVMPVAELILRLLDVGTETSLVIPISPSSDHDDGHFTHQLNAAADLVYFGTTDLAGPEVRPFRLPKPENTLRIIVAGESTVIGFPFSPELSFCRHIEQQLQRQLPQKNVEVLNAGITGIGSFALADLISQCRDASPDLVVLHAGHNEFYGAGAPGSTSFNFSPWIIRSAFTVRHFRTVQLLAGGYGKTVLQEDLFDTLPAQMDIPFSGAIYTQALENYALNLRRIVRLCRDAGLPLLVVPVECNLRDQSPLMSNWPDSVKRGRGRWQTLMSEAADLMAAQRFEEAILALNEAVQIAPEHATSRYRLGQCLQQLNRLNEAHREFAIARDMDGCRFRMPSTFYSVAKTAVSGAGDHCHYLDLAEGFVQEGYQGAPGRELYLEHVHYTFEGHYIVGKLIARAVLEQCLQKKWSEESVPGLDEATELLGFLPEDELAAVSIVIQMLRSRPFAKCLDRELHEAELVVHAASVFESMSESRRSVFADLMLSQMADNLLEHLQSAHRARGNAAFADELLAKRKQRTPWKNAD